MSSSLLVPLAFWNNLTNPIFTTVLSKHPHVFAGLQNGHIWIYTAIHDTSTNQVELGHKLLLVGHKAPVAALCLTQTETDTFGKTEDILISASEDGEIIRWNVADGRCLATNPRGFYGVPKSLKAFPSDQTSSTPTKDKYIFCSGFSDGISILDAQSLDMIHIWGDHPNWVTCTPFYDPVLHRRRLLTVTFDGVLNLWDFDSRHAAVSPDYTPLEPLNVADEVLDLRSSGGGGGGEGNENGELIMALTRAFALIFTIRESRFAPQVKIPCPADSSWAGGVFASGSRLVLWSQTGEIHDHLICAPQGIRRGSMVQHANQLYYRAIPLKFYRWPAQKDDDQPRILTTVFPSAIDPAASISVGLRNRPDRSTFVAGALRAVDPARATDTEEDWDQKVEEEELPRETELVTLWPALGSSPPRTQTVSTVVYDAHLAIGYDTGEIVLTPVSVALIEDEYGVEAAAESHKTLIGHRGKVTCIFAPDSRTFGKKYLMSGGEDCVVRMWGLNDGKPLAAFATHAQPVTSFLEPPSDVGTRLRGCVVSVARDNSACVISLEEISCLYIFPGHSYPLCSIQWRPAEDYLVMAYADGTAFVWQIQTAHVDRVVTGPRAAEVLGDGRWKTSHVKGDDFKTSNFKQTITSFPIYSGAGDPPTLQIFMINVKHLVNDVYNSTLARPSIDLLDSAAPDLAPGPAVGEAGSEAVRAAVADAVGSGSGFGVLQKDHPKSPKVEKDPETMLLSAVVSALMSWGVDPSVDLTCEKFLGLRRPRGCLTLGTRGSGGNLSLLAPTADPRTCWTVSPVVSAMRLLAVVSLVRSLLSVRGLEAQSTALITHYASILPELIGEKFAYPSFSFLSKYWQDASVNVQQSARTLFSSTLARMRPEAKQATVDYWMAFLPASTPLDISSQLMARSTFILGIMGSDHPEVLSPATIKPVALSLMLLLNDDPKTSSRIVAMELLARGFATWEPYLKTSELFRTLFAYATTDPPDNLPIAPSTSSSSTLLQPGIVPTISTSTSASSAVQTTRQARAAVFQIATVNTPLFVSTLTYDLMNGKKAQDRTAILKVISLVVRKKPAPFYSSVPRIAEAVVRTLDPNVPNMREAALQTATAMLHDLVKTYPTVDFHGPSQKLAVGTLEGAAIVYDLRTATRWVVLEGHTKPITALSFSPDGRAVVSCSVPDGTVRMWRPSPGIFGMLASSLASTSTATDHTERGRAGSLSASQKAYRTYSFGIDDGENKQQAELSIPVILKEVGFEWLGDKTVRLKVKHMVMTFNV